MSRSIASTASGSPRELADVAPRMAKADLRKAESEDFRAEIGEVVERARMRCGWSLKELAGKVNRDPRQVARWETGDERAPLDVLFAVPELQQPLVIELAGLAGDVEVTTQITIKRPA